MRRLVALGVVAFTAATACSLLNPLDDLRAEAGAGDGGTCEAGTLCGGASCIDTTTDGRNCGACGHDCFGGGCSASACLPVALASNQASPFGLAVDSQRVYWANNDYDSSFATCLLSGCTDAGPTTLLSSQTLPADVFLANGHLYMSEYGHEDGGLGAVLACDPTDCAKTVVTIANEPVRNPVAVVADSTAVYWSNFGAGRIDTCSTSGGCGAAPATLANDTPGGPWYGLAIASQSIYWTSQAKDAGAVYACAVGGCAKPTTIAMSAGGPWDLAVDGTYVFWTTGDDGQVLRCPLAGCGSDAPFVIAANQGFPGGIAADASGVYWVNQKSGGVLHCAATGCPSSGPQVLATGQNQPWEIVLDDKSLYWSNAGTSNDGSIMRLAKP